MSVILFKHIIHEIVVETLSEEMIIRLIRAGMVLVSPNDGNDLLLLEIQATTLQQEWT